MRFGAGTRALYATDGSNYRQVPIGVVIPRRSTTSSRRWRSAARTSAPVLSRGGGTSLAGQCCNVAVVIDFSKYLHRIVDDRPRAEARARRSRASSSTSCAKQAAAVRPDVRPRSVDARPLHARRHDRQQLLRRPLGHGAVLRARAADLRQRRTSSRCSPTTARRLAAGASGTSGDRREIDRRLLDLARPLRRPDPRALPGHPAPRLRLQPRRAAARRTASTSRARSSAPRAPASPSSRRRCTCSTARRPLAARARLRGQYAAADHVTRVLEHRPTRARGRRRQLVEDMKVARHARRATSRCCPTAAAGCSSSSAARRRRRPTSEARECMDALKHGDGAPRA